MFTIFNNEEQKFYSENKECHWKDSIEEAQNFKTLESAKNFAKSSLKDKIAFLSYIDKETGLCVSSIMSKEEAESLYEELQQAIENLGQIAQCIPSLIEYYSNVMSECDKLQEDLLHKFEFAPAGNILFIKLGKMLKKCREGRREVKNRVTYLSSIENCKFTSLFQTHRNIIAGLENRMYTPRIAKELFE